MATVSFDEVCKYLMKLRKQEAQRQHVTLTRAEWRLELEDTKAHLRVPSQWLECSLNCIKARELASGKKSTPAPQVVPEAPFVIPKHRSFGAATVWHSLPTVATPLIVEHAIPSPISMGEVCELFDACVALGQAQVIEEFASLPLEYEQGPQPTALVRMRIGHAHSMRIIRERKLSSQYLSEMRAREAAQLLQACILHAIKYASLERPAVIVKQQDLFSLPTVMWVMGDTASTSATQTEVITPETLPPSVVEWRKKSRIKWSKEKEKEDAVNINRLANQQGITPDMAARAYYKASQPVDSIASILPELGGAYKKSRWKTLKLFGRNALTRSQRNIGVRLGSATAGRTLQVPFAPVSNEEMSSMRQRYDTDSYVVDAIEVCVNPMGLHGNDTDLTVLATYAYETDPDRAFIGSTSCFLGNGVYRTVFYTELVVDYASAKKKPPILIGISSTNATVDPDGIIAQGRVGVLREHLGPAHQRTIARSINELQRNGGTLVTRLQGNTVTIGRAAGDVTGIPSAEVDIGGGSRLINDGGLSFRAENIKPGRFKISGSRDPILDRSVSALPFNRRANMLNIERADTVEPPRASHSSVHSDTFILKGSLEPTEYAVVDTNPINSLLGTTFATIPKDAKADRVLARLSLRDILQSTRYPQFWEMFKQHTFVPKFKIKLSIPGNAFTGLALGVCMDWYGRLYDAYNANSDLSWQYARLVPNHVFSCGTPGPHEFTFDLAVEGGHSMCIDGSNFGYNESMYVYVVSANQKVLANDHIITMEVYTETSKANGFFFKPIVEFPLSMSSSLPANYVLGKYSVDNATRITNIDLTPARVTTSTAGASIAWWQAWMRSWLGYNCRFRFRVVPTSTAMVGAFLRVHVQAGSDEKTAVQYPHIDTAVEQSFEIDMRAQYWSSQIQTPGPAGGAYLVVNVIGGVQIPQDLAVKYEFLLVLESLEKLEVVTPSVGNNSIYDWCTIRNFTKDSFRIAIPSRYVDMKAPTTDYAIDNAITPVSQLLSASAYHHGSIKLHFRWAWEKPFNELRGYLKFENWCGTAGTNPVVKQLAGQSMVVPMQQNPSCVIVPFEYGSILGPTGLVTTAYNEHFLDVSTSYATHMSQLQIAVEFLPGFKIYGKSCIKPVL